MEKEGNKDHWKKTTKSGPPTTEQRNETNEQNLPPRSTKGPFPWTILIIVTILCLVVAILMLVEASQ